MSKGTVSSCCTPFIYIDYHFIIPLVLTATQAFDKEGSNTFQCISTEPKKIAENGQCHNCESDQCVLTS